MIELSDIQSIIGDNFFGGNGDVQGMAMFLFAILIVFGLTKKPFFALIVGMVITLMFSTLGILSAELTILLIIVSVLGLAYTTRRTMG